MKTGFLEIRPLYHRKATRTRGCAVIAMFAYMILHYMFQRCSHLEIPLESVIEKLDQIQIEEYEIGGNWVPMLPSIVRDDQESILKALDLTLPKSLTQKRSVPIK
jgi:hypothetical protein